MRRKPELDKKTWGMSLRKNRILKILSLQIFQTFFLQNNSVTYRDKIINLNFRGIIEFDRKNNAARAIDQVNQGCFFLTLAPRAVVCNAVEAEDADDGLREVINLEFGQVF